MAPNIYAALLAAIGIAGNSYIFVMGSNVSATASGMFSPFNMLYYLMVIPMFIAVGLIYSILKKERKKGRTKKNFARIYLVCALLGLSTTLWSSWEIRNAKSRSGFTFPSHSKKRMEKYKTDLFEGRLKKFAPEHRKNKESD